MRFRFGKAGRPETARSVEWPTRRAGSTLASHWPQPGIQRRRLEGLFSSPSRPVPNHRGDAAEALSPGRGRFFGSVALVSPGASEPISGQVPCSKVRFRGTINAGILPKLEWIYKDFHNCRWILSGLNSATYGYFKAAAWRARFCWFSSPQGTNFIG